MPNDHSPRDGHSVGPGGDIGAGQYANTGSRPNFRASGAASRYFADELKFTRAFTQVAPANSETIHSRAVSRRLIAIAAYLLSQTIVGDLI